MARARFALWLLARADHSGSGEALVGDVVEGIASGHSRFWVWQQLMGMWRFALVGHVRKHARVTPHLVAAGLAVVLLGGVSIASLGSVLQAWLSFYLASGTMSLLAHILARTSGSRPLLNFE